MQKVVLKPHIFDDREAIQFELKEGACINDFISQANLPVALNNHLRASINGVPCNNEDFNLPLKLDDNINIYVVPMGGDGGGKSILRIVASIVVIYFAPYLAGYVGVIGGIGATGQAVLSMAFLAVGMMAVNALIPPPKLDTGGYNSNTASTNVYTITGQSNAMSPYGVIPRLYGTHLFFPRLAGQPLVWNSGTSSYMTALYDFGYAELEATNIKIGQTSIDNYTTQTNYLPSTKGAGLKFYTKKVNLQSIAVELKQGNEVTRESADNSNNAEIEIAFPRGLVNISDTGDYLETSVDIEVSYRRAGSSDSFIKTNFSMLP